MTTNYPATIDTAANIALAINNITPINAALINNLRGAIISIEQTLGVNPAATYGTVAARLMALENTADGGNIKLGGDLGGTVTVPLVIGIYGRPISNVAPTNGEPLIWNGTSWTPGNNFGSLSLFTTGGITSGPILSTSISTGLSILDGKLIVNGISTSSISDSGQGIIYFDSTLNKFLVSENGGSYDALATFDTTAGGDLTGSYPNPNVAKVQNVPVSATAPTNQQALVFNGTQYVPQGVQQVFNVKNYGAACNANYQNLTNYKWYVDSGLTTEATDDTLAIQNTINAASSVGSNTAGVVLLTGNMYLKTPLQLGVGAFSFAVFCTVTDNIVIRGDGTANLRLGPGLQTSNWCMFYSQNNINNGITFENILMDGNAQSGSAVNQHNSFIALIGQDGYNITLDNCTFQNQCGWNAVILSPFGSTPFDLDGYTFTNVRVTNCSFLQIGNNNTLTDCVQLYLQAKGAVISNNKFYNDPALGSNPRRVGNCMQLQLIDSIISNNVITNVSNAIALCSIFNVNVDNVAITGNTINLTSIGIGFVQAVGQTFSNVTITGNVFNISNDSASQLEAAIQIQTPNAGNIGLDNLIISNNVMTYTHDPASSDAAPFAINLTGSVRSIQISDNRMTNFPNGGITIQPIAGTNENNIPPANVVASDLKIWDTVITGNLITNCGNGNIVNYPIALVCDTAYDPLQRIRITNNSISRTDGTSQNYGIVVAGDGYDVVVIENFFYGITTQILVEAVSYTLTNIYTGVTNVPNTLVQRDAASNINTSYLTTINSGWLYSENGAGSGTQIMMGLDINDSLRLAPSADAIVIVGAPLVSTGCVDGDLLLAENTSLRFPLGSSSAIRAIGFDGYVQISADGEPIQLGLIAGSASGGSGPATLGNGFGLGGNNPTTTTQNGWIKLYDSSGNAFFVPIWR